MNRRNFLKNSALALFGFAVLPPASTYDRLWKARRKQAVAFAPWIGLNPEYVNAPFEMAYWMEDGLRSRIVEKGAVPKHMLTLAYPLRYIQENGIFKQVPAFS